MAGGLFGRPFALNEKCIVFSLIIMIIFLFKPNFKSNIVLYVTLFIIFVISYVAMAWYDYFYDCRLLPLKRGKYGITGLFKPPPHVAEKQVEQKKLTKLESKRTGMIIYLSHILLFVPILCYVAYYKQNSGDGAFSILVALAIFTAGYHAMRLLSIIHKKFSTKALVIYLTHLLVICPLLLYVGIQKKKTNKYAFYALYVLAALAFIYHGRYMMKIM
tara:strand:+ start:22 stop:672 length:651 start_codon:yes stop_codon:yes gene_type:complete